MKRFVEVVFNVVLTLAVLAMVFLFWFGIDGKALDVTEVPTDNPSVSFADSSLKVNCQAVKITDCHDQCAHWSRNDSGGSEAGSEAREAGLGHYTREPCEPLLTVVECVVIEVVEPKPVDCEGAPPVADEATEAVGQTLVFAQAKRGENALVPPRRLYAVPLEAELQEFMIGKAEEIGVDPAVIFGMARKESTYNASAIGDNGASYGLMQVQPRWNKARMERLGCLDLLDPYQNVTVAADLLAELMAKHGDVAVALTVYNNGHYPGYVTEYAKTVMRYAEELNYEEVCGEAE